MENPLKSAWIPGTTLGHQSIAFSTLFGALWPNWPEIKKQLPLVLSISLDLLPISRQTWAWSICSCTTLKCHRRLLVQKKSPKGCGNGNSYTVDEWWLEITRIIRSIDFRRSTNKTEYSVFAGAFPKDAGLLLLHRWSWCCCGSLILTVEVSRSVVHPDVVKYCPTEIEDNMHKILH